MQRMCTVQPKSGHPEDTLPEWNVTKPSLHNRGGNMERAEQSRAIRRSEVFQQARAQRLSGL